MSFDDVQTISQPKRADVVRRLRADIVEGRLSAGSPLLRRIELARELDASVFTVQCAIDQLTEEGFVRSVRGQGTFVADHPPHLHHFGLVLPGLADTLYYDALIRATDELQRSFASAGSPGRRVAVYRYIESRSTDAGYVKLARAVVRQQLAGLIFAFPPVDLAGTPLLDHPGVPRVAAMGPQYAFPGVARLQIDIPGFYSAAAARLAVMGRRRPAVIMSGRHASDRSYAHVSILRAHGLDVPDHFVQGVQFDQSYWASHAVQLLMRLPDGQRPDSLIIADDNMVESATGGLKQSGLRAPNDVTVIAHANFPAPPQAHVPVTYLGFDAGDLLRMGMKRIDDLRAYPGQPGSDVPVLKPRFVEPTGQA